MNLGDTYAGAWGTIFDAASLALTFSNAKENNLVDDSHVERSRSDNCCQRRSLR